MVTNSYLLSYYPACSPCFCKYVWGYKLNCKSLTLWFDLDTKQPAWMRHWTRYVLQNRNTHLWLTLHPDLASHCRLLLHDRPKHTKLYRWLALYPLYVLSEIAIICTDLAELLGSAIALCMLFPKLPLWAGVLLTVLDVFFLLALGDPLRGRPVKMFEYLIVALVSCVVHISQ